MHFNVIRVEMVIRCILISDQSSTDKSSILCFKDGKWFLLLQSQNLLNEKDFTRLWCWYIMHFWGFRADFNPPKGGSKSARNPPKRHNAIERRLKKRTKIASPRRSRVDAIFLRFFNRRSIALCLFGGFRVDLDPSFWGLKSARNP